MELQVDLVEKVAFNRTSQGAGLSLSAWVWEQCMRIARKELEDMSMPAAFLEWLSA